MKNFSEHGRQLFGFRRTWEIILVINNKGDNSLVLMKNFSDAGNICI